MIDLLLFDQKASYCLKQSFKLKNFSIFLVTDQILIFDDQQHIYDQIILETNNYEILQPEYDLDMFFIRDIKTQIIYQYQMLLKTARTVFNGDYRNVFQFHDYLCVVVQNNLQLMQDYHVVKEAHLCFELSDFLNVEIRQNGIVINNGAKSQCFSSGLQPQEVQECGEIVVIDAPALGSERVSQLQSLSFIKLITQIGGRMVFLPITIYYDYQASQLCLINATTLLTLRLNTPIISQLSLCCCKNIILLAFSVFKNDESQIFLYVIDNNFMECSILMDFGVFGRVRSLSIIKHDSIVLSVVTDSNTIFIKKVEDGPYSISKSFNTTIKTSIVFDISDNEVILIDTDQNHHLIAIPQGQHDGFSHILNPSTNVYNKIPEVLSCYCSRFNNDLSFNEPIIFPPGVDVELQASDFNSHLILEELKLAHSSHRIEKQSFYKANNESFTIDFLGLTQRFEDLRIIAKLIAKMQSRANSFRSAIRPDLSSSSEQVAKIVSNIKVQDLLCFQDAKKRFKKYSISQILIQSLYQTIKISGYRHSQVFSYNILSLMFSHNIASLETQYYDIILDVYQRVFPILYYSLSQLPNDMRQQFKLLLEKIFNKQIKEIQLKSQTDRKDTGLDFELIIQSSLTQDCYTNENDFIFTVSVVLLLSILAGLSNIRQFDIGDLDFSLLEQFIEYKLKSDNLYVRILYDFMCQPNMLTSFASIVVIRKFMMIQLLNDNFSYSNYLRTVRGQLENLKQSQQRLPYLILVIECFSQPLYHLVGTTIDIEVIEALSYFKNIIVESIAFVFSIIQDHQSLEIQDQSSLSLAIHCLAYNMYYFNKVMNYEKNSGDEELVDIQSQIVGILLKYNKFLQSTEQRVFIFEQIVHYIFESGYTQLQLIMAEIYKSNSILMFQSVNEFITYIKYNYPSILSEYGSVFIDELFISLIDQFQHLKQDQSLKETMEVEVNMVQSIIQSSHCCQDVCNRKTNEQLVFFQPSDHLLRIFSFKTYKTQDILLPKRIQFDFIRLIETPDQTQLLVAYSSSWQCLLINLDITRTNIEYLLLPVNIGEQTRSKFDFKNIQPFECQDQKVFIGIGTSSDFLKIKIAVSPDHFIGVEFKNIFNVGYSFDLLDEKYCGVLKLKNHELIMSNNKLPNIQYLIAKQEINILVRIK